MRGLEMVPRRVFGEVEEVVEEKEKGDADVGGSQEVSDDKEKEQHEFSSEDNTAENVMIEEAKQGDPEESRAQEEIADAPDSVTRKSELEMALEDEEKIQQQIWGGTGDDVEQVVEAIEETEDKQEMPDSFDASPTDAQEAPPNEEPEEESKPPRKPLWGGTTEVLGADESWKNRVINIAGNHDVGYAGDLDDYRIERFEKAFGSVNWDIWFTLPIDPADGAAEESPSADSVPALRLVILNSMNLDTPAWNSEMQTETYKFMNHIITSARSVDDKTHATILLTHIPLEKQSGICVDSPLFNFYEEGQGIKEQNMLSDFSTKTVLENIYGMSDNMFAPGEGFGRRGIILNGHDHEGCDVTHFLRQSGVYDACDPRYVKREDAHWPASTSSSTTSTTSTSVTTNIRTTYETSPANPFVLETSPLPSDPPSSQEEDEPAEEEPDPSKGWRAHRYPHRQYSITHYPLTNTTSCTSIERSPHIREITLRSMMGEFSGYAGFLSAWFDRSKGEKGEWVFEFATCGVGVQHWWWAVHIIDIVLVVLMVAGFGFRAWEGFSGQSAVRDARHMNGNGRMGVNGRKI